LNNWFKTAKEEHTQKEINDWFNKRTNKHIELVGKYCKILADYDPDRFSELLERLKVHDDSKFKDPEIEPYKMITWKYKCKDEGWDFNEPEGLAKDMEEATLHHITTNSHHPEYWAKGEVKLNSKDRDKPSGESLDCTAMPELDLSEMVCDWASMGQEKGNTTKSWADKNVNIRWKFTDKQKDLIYELVDVVDKKGK
jgi:hypothetical protein